MLRTLRWMLLAAATGCAGSEALTPEQRYVEALKHKVDGDARGYHDALIALAHEAPDSRGGRRARATVQSSGWLTSLMGWGTAAGLVAWVVPALRSTDALTAIAGEPEALLGELRDKQMEFFELHQRYCRTFVECGWQAPDGARFLYYLNLDEVAGGTGLADPSLLRLRAEAFLAEGAAQQIPEFLGLAIGESDDPTGLRIVYVDRRRGEIVNFAP
jgi:hypothetical protein